jgi:hypothetical protein
MYTPYNIDYLTTYVSSIYLAKSVLALSIESFILNFLLHTLPFCIHVVEKTLVLVPNSNFFSTSLKRNSLNTEGPGHSKENIYGKVPYFI